MTKGAVVLYGRCDEDLGARQPFAEAIRRWRRVCQPPSGLRPGMPFLVPGLVDLLPDLLAGTRADPDTERLRIV